MQATSQYSISPPLTLACALFGTCACLARGSHAPCGCDCMPAEAASSCMQEGCKARNSVVCGSQCHCRWCGWLSKPGMLSQVRRPAEALPLLWEQLVLHTPSGQPHVLYHHALSYAAELKRPKAVHEPPMKGGILADEMGVNSDVAKRSSINCLKTFLTLH